MQTEQPSSDSEWLFSKIIDDLIDAADADKEIIVGTQMLPTVSDFRHIWLEHGLPGRPISH